MKESRNEEKMILKHDPIPPFREIFYIVFLLGSFYLAAIIILGAK